MKDFSPIVRTSFIYSRSRVWRANEVRQRAYAFFERGIYTKNSLSFLNGARTDRVSCKVTLTLLQNDFSGDLDTMELDLVGSGGHLVGSGGDHAHNSQSHHHFSAQHSFQNLLEDISTEENIDIPIMVNISRFIFISKYSRKKIFGHGKETKLRVSSYFHGSF